MIRMVFAGLLAGILAVFASATAVAQTLDPVDISALGPQLGETVPDFTLPDQTGALRTLDSIMGERGAMLVFYRSADW